MMLPTYLPIVGSYLGILVVLHVWVGVPMCYVRMPWKNCYLNGVPLMGNVLLLPLCETLALPILTWMCSHQKFPTRPLRNLPPVRCRFAGATPAKERAHSEPRRNARSFLRQGQMWGALEEGNLSSLEESKVSDCRHLGKVSPSLTPARITSPKFASKPSALSLFIIIRWPARWQTKIQARQKTCAKKNPKRIHVRNQPVLGGGEITNAFLWELFFGKKGPHGHMHLLCFNLSDTYDWIKRVFTYFSRLLPWMWLTHHLPATEPCFYFSRSCEQKPFVSSKLPLSSAGSNCPWWCSRACFGIACSCRPHSSHSSSSDGSSFSL